MVYVIAIHEAEPTKLARVKSEMARLGAPKIRVIAYGDNQYLALEGSHRLAAASELGMPVDLDIVDLDYDDERRLSDMGLGYDSDNTIEELCDVDHRNPVYELETV
jgi:hypothetical protein